MDLYDAVDWITKNGQNGGNYSIVLGSDLATPNVVLDCGGKKVAIFLKSARGERKVTFLTRSPSTYLFTVKAGVTFTLEEGVTLSGLQSASMPPVGVDGGAFVMNGGAIKDSKISGSWFGGGVDILSGSFTMNGGAISGNSCTGGGGVCVGSSSSRRSATFTMNGGTISGNTGDHGGGGGVCVNGGTFTMNNGTISGNTADNTIFNGGGGGGVWVSSGTFMMNNGTISGNTANNSLWSGGAGGGGVYVSGGTFTMSGGKISENTASVGSGGGVLVNGGGGAFTMSGGEISENTAKRNGGGVYVDSGTFTKSGSDAVIYGADRPEQANRADGNGHAVYTRNGSRDSTARANMTLDSTKKGTAGGWE
jgi:hypothetical protein